MDTFQNLALALDAMAKGGNAPCVLNAANEVAVAAFLEDGLPFGNIPRIIEHCLAAEVSGEVDDLATALDVDKQARRTAAGQVDRRSAGGE